MKKTVSVLLLATIACSAFAQINNEDSLSSPSADTIRLCLPHPSDSIFASDSISHNDSLRLAPDTSLCHERKKVAVVLSGGGAKGVAHIGALKVIEQAGIPIDFIVGTSMGSIVGGLYSIGYDADALDSLVKAQDWKWLLSDNPDPTTLSLEERQQSETYLLTRSIVKKDDTETKGGLVSGKNLANLFSDLTVGYHDSIDFNTLPIPFACVATSMTDYSEVVFRSGKLAQAMRASMAIPAAFTPVRIDSLILVDGGMKNNYPVDIARSMGADIVIGVTVQSPLRSTDNLVTTMDILSQIIDFNVLNKYQDNIDDTDVLVEVNLQDYSSSSFTSKALDTMTVRGYKAAMGKWDEIIALRDTLRLPEGYMPEKISRAVVTEDDEDDDTQTATPTSAELEASVGMRFDIEELVALQINTNFSLPTRTPVEFSLTGRLGQRYMGRVEAIVRPTGFCNLSVIYTFRHNDTDFYSEGDKAYNTTYNYHNVDLTFLNISGKNYRLDFAARWENYHINSVLVSSDFENLIASPTNETLYSAHARLHYDSEDSRYFTTRGAVLDVKYGIYTDNCAQYKDGDPIQVVSALWRVAARLNSRLTLQPTVYGRMVWGENMPWCLANYVGGTFTGHYMDQQMPFPGVGYVEPVDKVMVVIGTKIQQRIMDNNYLFARVAAGVNANKMRHLFDHTVDVGFCAGWAYDSLFGPVGATFGYSNITKSLDFYINLGYEF